MITDQDIEFDINKGYGKALVWIIDGDCLYDLPLNLDYAEIFLSYDDILDVSHEYPENTGITVRFMKDGSVLNEFNTSEYFGSILLSDPLVLNLSDYPYGRYVQSPYAKFDGEKFIILNQNVVGMVP